jgi:hypothetical protein
VAQSNNLSWVGRTVASSFLVLMPVFLACGNARGRMRNVGLNFTNEPRRWLNASPAYSRQIHLHFDNRNESVDEEIWILLTRHVVNSCRTSDFISLKVEVEDDLKSSSSIMDQIAIAAKVRNYGYSKLLASYMVFTSRAITRIAHMFWSVSSADTWWRLFLILLDRSGLRYPALKKQAL